MTRFVDLETDLDFAEATPLVALPAALDFNHLAYQFRSISLADMAQVKLMNRTDTKFILPASMLETILERAASHYLIQQIAGNFQARYATCYYDTAAHSFFIHHLNGKLNRLKWRVRSYLDSNISFLEMKQKTNKGRTIKQRMVCEAGPRQGFQLCDHFIHENSGFRSADLQPSLENGFHRITLVSKAMNERVTIDYNIGFRNLKNRKAASLPQLAIIEIKQDKSNRSEMRELLRHLRIKSQGISKYCLGLTLTDGQLKTNRYKRKIRTIQKLIIKQ